MKIPSTHYLKPFILLVALQVTSLLDGCQEKTNEDTSSNGIKNYLSFQLSSAHHLQIKSEKTYQYEMTTTGEDPYVYLVPLYYKNPQENVVLTFEYQSTKRIDFLQIFFAPPLNEERSIKSEGFPETETWKTFSIDLGEAIEKLGWGNQGDFLRLDFGNEANITLHIKNIQLRARNTSEEEAAKKREEKRLNDLLLEENLKKYLSAQYESAIYEATITDTKVIVEGIASGEGNYKLCEVTPYEELLLTSAFQEGISINDSHFHIELERFVNKGEFVYDRLLSMWVIVDALTNKIVSHAHYANKINSLQHMPVGQLKGRKGLGGFAVSRGFLEDLDDLNITSVTVNVAFTSFMYLTARPNTLNHNYGGKTYYFDKAAIDDLDKTLQIAQQKGIIVAAIILIQKSEECADSAIGELLQHPDYTSEGIFTMPNMTTPASLNCYAAALDFLSSRYNRPDNAYGRIHYWIMHNEVDAGLTWTNMGEKPMAVYMNTYIKSMRLCYNIARSYDSNAQVFASFTHSWAQPVEPRFYSTTEMLENLLQHSNAEGDFQWGIAYHSYPEDLNEPKTWNDKNATFSMNSPLVTFKNLEVLDAWIKKSENKFHGTIKRSLWLSENGTNSRTYSEKDLAEQAAGAAYAWKKLKYLNGIDAMQWHNWIDNRYEFGLRLGLRRFPDDEEDPGGRKPVWFVYQAADTDQEDMVFEKYKPIIGIQRWDEVYYNNLLNL
jgi:hypothetical protein